MKAMKTPLNILLGLLLIGMVGKACAPSENAPANDGADSGASDARSADRSSSAASAPEEYVLDAGSVSSCENYLKGKTFSGGSARLKFGYDGTVSAYDASGSLVFGGTLEIGAKKSAVSRWIYVRDMSGGGELQFLLSNDGKMIEPSSLVIYKPE